MDSEVLRSADAIIWCTGFRPSLSHLAGLGLRTPDGRIPHPEMVVLKSMREDREPAWALTLDAAKHGNIPLWADDTGLRRVAHSLGIKTFSTHALLTIAYERQRIDAETFDQTICELIREHVVDLPADYAMLEAVAAEQDWHAGSVAIILGRGPTWVDRRQALELFLTAYRNAPDDHLKSWAFWAISGLRDATAQDHHEEVLANLAVLTFLSGQGRASRAAASTAALDLVMPELGQAVIHRALKELWNLVKDMPSVDRAVILYFQIIGGLDDVHRQYGAQVILER
ncbi:hypothetical protein [Saccharothrix sp. ALI-22-I]|uniref:hypothetical protein n=1 Tax=Saccharothrix sp. ALI-22-I TaxID=1933778 RepID=UPI00117A4837|nr:hypothetical protein [Saccharothrix sp. ALI-22-I]